MKNYLKKHILGRLLLTSANFLMATDTGPILRAQSVLRELTPASNLTPAVNSFIHTWRAWQTQVHPSATGFFATALQNSHISITH